MEGLGWVLKALVAIEGIGCVVMGWAGYDGSWVGDGVLELIQNVYGGYGMSIPTLGLSH